MYNYLNYRGRGTILRLVSRKMASHAVRAADARAALLHPPAVPPGLAALDRGHFSKEVSCVRRSGRGRSAGCPHRRDHRVNAVVIEPRSCSKFIQALRPHLLNIPKRQNIVPCPTDGARKLLLLAPGVEAEALPGPARALVEGEGHGVVRHAVRLGFDFWTVEQILRAALPPEVKEVPSSFETIGHIAHLNLRDEHAPHKRLIAEVLLAKNRSIRTVVNKTGVIDTVFRFFNMEVLAGEEDFEAEVRESGCIFRMRFDRVYWNSRLHGEHDRIVQQLRPDDVVADMFAGIGPFALPAGKRGALVHANDLNPASHAALLGNIKLNKLAGAVLPYNLDGRAFIRQLVADTAAAPEPERRWFTQVFMNLPASATEFLDVFRGLYAALDPALHPEAAPTVHCYLFTSAEDLAADALRMCEAVLEHPLEPATVTVHEVRDVAPRKRMMCVSFVLPDAVSGRAARQAAGASGQAPESKRPRVEPA